MTLKNIASISFVLLAAVAFAQPAPPATPIDGGLGILLAGGVAYGLKKLHDKKKA